MMKKLLPYILVFLCVCRVNAIEIICKVGDKVAKTDPTYEQQFKDGQVINIRPDNFYIYKDGKINGERTCKHFCVIQIPAINFWQINGMGKDTGTYIELKQKIKESNFTKIEHLDVKKFTASTSNGKYRWDNGYEEAATERKRDWYVDFKWLEQQGYITKEQYESIYDKEKNHLPIVLDLPLTTLFKNENINTRIPSALRDSSKGTIDAGGIYTVGTAQTYPDWSDAVADLPADIGAMTTPGNIILSGNTDEEISESTVILMSLDTDSYYCKFTVAESFRHDGGAYGNGHRVNFSDYDRFEFDDAVAGNVNNSIIEYLAIDVSGSENIGVYCDDGGNSAPNIIQNCLFKGDANSISGVTVMYNHTRTIIRNNIAYGFTKADTGGGIRVNNEWATTQCEVYNNTCCDNTNGIMTYSDTPSTGNYYFMNNLCYGNGTDYTGTGDWDTDTDNASGDDTGTDDVDNWSNEAAFVDYDNNDYLLDETDAVLILADDLSGIGAPAQFGIDITDQTRVDWYCGASEFISGEPPAETPKFMPNILYLD